MAYFDFPLEELKIYKPERPEPANFDLFWENTLMETRTFPLNARFQKINNELETIDTYDVEFNGFGGQSIKAWFSTPRNPKNKLPCIIEFIGYGGGRGFPIDWLVWPSAGYAHLVMDTRGQGSVWRKGDTPDGESGANPASPGFMTQGILDPSKYYYRRLFTDSVRAIEAARSHPLVDTNCIALTGGSQGGGLAIAAAGLDPTVNVLMADVPFLCHFKRAIEITDTYPYQELVTFCKTHRDKHEIVFHTLSYFDVMNFAARVKALALVSVGLMDDVCPPSTVFAAYNYIPGQKEIRIYPYNRHEGGDDFHAIEKLRFINNLWRSH